MELRYLPIRSYYAALQPVSGRFRRTRMSQFSRVMRPWPGMRVLDLGGQPEIWRSLSVPLDITILNLPGVDVPAVESHHKITRVQGDACAVAAYGDQEFDLVFSNSVIEHVGPEQKQAEFAREVRRLGRSYWVQTPAIWFPVEPHAGMPFWFFYPDSVRSRLLDRWRQKLPAWTTMVEETRVLSHGLLRRLFPDGECWVERIAGIPKSYAMFRCAAPQ